MFLYVTKRVSSASLQVLYRGAIGRGQGLREKKGMAVLALSGMDLIIRGHPDFIGFSYFVREPVVAYLCQSDLVL